MATVIYGKYIREAMLANIDLAVDVIRAALIQASPAGAPDNPDHEFVSDIITGAVSAECTFSNYVRKTLAGVAVAYDATNNRVEFTFDALVYASAGGGVNNTVGALLLYKQVGGDDSTPANDPVIGYFDIGDTITNGNTMTLTPGTEGAVWAASA